MERVYRQVILALILIGLVAVPVFGQRLDGSLRGEVTDPSGAVVPGATITITNEDTNVVQKTTTTSAGIFNFPNLLVGTYTLKVDAKGFAPYMRKGITVASNQVTDTTARLRLGTEATEVEVVAGSDVVETTTSQISNTFDARTISDITTATSSPLNLAVLAPGTTSQGGGVLGSGGSVGGTRPRMNNFTIDGVDDNDQSVTGPVSTVINDAVAEFSLVTNQFSAEYGHSAGGQFNIITKSGTNDLHGSLFWYTQNRNLNALDNLQKASFDPAVGKPRYDRNLLGGSVGGPIIKNRWFIFGAMQYDTRGRGTTSTPVGTPTAAGLSALQGFAANDAVRTILDQFPVAPAADACNPALAQGAAGACPFVNGQAIPIGYLSFAAPDFYNEYDWQANSDLILGKHQLRFRFLYNRYRAPNLPAPALPQFSGDLTYDVRKGTFADAWAINDKFINDFRLGFTHQVQDYTVPNQFAAFPNITLDEPTMSNFVIGPESNSPQNGGQNVYQLLDQMTYSRGKHTFKWGVEFRRYISPSWFLPRERGDYYYSTLQNLVTDTVPVDFAKRGAGTGAFAGNSSALYWFVQDDLKLTPRFTLNLGLRYEWNGIPAGSNLQALNAISNLPGVYDFRAPRSDRNNFAPRVGFAWDPTGEAKWSIRGGFGIAYDVTFTNLPLLSLPPQLQSEQDPVISCALPAAPSWCSGFNATLWNAGGLTGPGFLQNGALLSVNVPPETQADARAATQGFIVDNVAPRIFTWSFGIQRELFSNTSLEARYLGTISDNLPIQAQTNSMSAFDNGARPLQTWFNESEVPATLPLDSPTLAEFSSFIQRPYAPPLVPDGFLGSVTSFPPIGKSEYHSGSVDFIHRFNRGLYFRANYTYARGWDNSTNELFSSLVNPRRAEDWRHLDREWGRSTLDMHHKAAVSWSYQIPKAALENGFAKAVLHGWVLNGSYIFQTGQPITAQSAIDANGNGDSAGDRAVLNPNGTANTGSDIGTVFFNPTTGATCISSCGAAFSQTVGYYALTPDARFIRAGVGALTNVGRNTLDSPGLNNWDMSVFKNTYITESKYVQFRLEMFNVFNHRQYSFANRGAVGGADGFSNAATENFSYARVYSPDFLNDRALYGGARTIQLGLRFVF